MPRARACATTDSRLRSPVIALGLTNAASGSPTSATGKLGGGTTMSNRSHRYGPNSFSPARSIASASANSFAAASASGFSA